MSSACCWVVVLAGCTLGRACLCYSLFIKELRCPSLPLLSQMQQMLVQQQQQFALMQQQAALGGGVGVGVGGAAPFMMVPAPPQMPPAGASRGRPATGSHFVLHHGS